jgi:hypothetical protein
VKGNEAPVNAPAAPRVASSAHVPEKQLEQRNGDFGQNQDDDRRFHEG